MFPLFKNEPNNVTGHVLFSERECRGIDKIIVTSVTNSILKRGSFARARLFKHSGTCDTEIHPLTGTNWRDVKERTEYE